MRCGGCTLCCTLLEVAPLASPAGEACHHCVDGEGCNIWSERPAVCRNFSCLWYTTEQFGEDLRPDNCGAFFEPGGERVMLVASLPGAWREGIAWKLIEKFLHEGTSVIVQEPIGGGKTFKHFCLAAGDSYRELRGRATADARRRGFVR